MVDPSPPPPPRMVLAAWTWTPAAYLRAHLFVHAAAFILLGASMLAHPSRYTLGLVGIRSDANVQLWAAIFLTLAAVKICTGLWWPRLVRWVIIAGLVVLSIWLVWFTYAWLFREGSAFAVMAFGLLVSEHIVISTMVDNRVRW